jgi:DNA repair protein RecO (recombination protein O)
MITDALLGWVLHHRALRDTSAEVTFFTREKGLVKARFNSGRTPKNQSMLQPFTPLWLILDEKKYGFYVRQLEASAKTWVLLGQTIYAGLYVNELLYHILHQSEEDSFLFLAYEKTIQHLSESRTLPNVERALRRFEWALLESCGTNMSFVEDIDGAVISDDQGYNFIPGAGFFRAENGLSGRHILAIAQDQLDEADVLKTAKLIMRYAIDFLLNGARVHSRELGLAGFKSSCYA